jgi:hypothetical protein
MEQKEQSLESIFLALTEDKSEISDEQQGEESYADDEVQNKEQEEEDVE